MSECAKCEELKAKATEVIRQCHLAGLNGHTNACNKDPRGCWNVRCQLGKQCIQEDLTERAGEAVQRPVPAPFSFDVWTDAVWAAMRDLAQEDTAVKMLNAHTVREFCKASWVALSKAGGLPSDPRASDHLTEQQRQAITDANAGRMDIDDD